MKCQTFDKIHKSVRDIESQRDILAECGNHIAAACAQYRLDGAMQVFDVVCAAFEAEKQNPKTEKEKIMNTTTDKNETVTLENPWSKAVIEKPVADIINNGMDAYPWPENVREKLDGMVDSDEEWVIEAVKMMGPEFAGEIIIGS